MLENRVCLEPSDGRQAAKVRALLAVVLTVYSACRFGWSAGLHVSIAALFAILLDWMQFPRGGARSLAARFVLIAAQISVLFAVFFAPQPIGFAASFPIPMVMKTPFLILLLSFMASYLSAAQPLITIWAGLAVWAGWWTARMVILADPHTVTAASLKFSSFKTPLGLLRAACLPNFFNGGVWSIHMREIAIFVVVFGFASYRIHFLAGRTAKQVALRDALGAYFAPAVAELMAKSRRIGASRWSRPMAVLNFDLIGFTSLSERSEPDRVAEMLRAYRSVVEDAVFASQGAIVSFTGDGVTAVFGLTDCKGSCALAALNCALQVETEWTDAGRRLIGQDYPPIAAGIDYGQVRSGLVGEGRTLSLLIFGEPVKGAEKLQAMTRELAVRILISDALKRAADDSNPQLVDRMCPLEAFGSTLWTLRIE
jgi:adenylate cyclase